MDLFKVRGLLSKFRAKHRAGLKKPNGSEKRKSNLNLIEKKPHKTLFFAQNS